MTKSKVKSLNLRSTQGDFLLQTKHHAFALPTPRVQSKSYSLVQHGSISPSPTSTPPRTKVAFANFADFSNAARVSSKHKKRTMQKKGSPAPSLYCPSFGGRNGGSSSSSRARPFPTLAKRPAGFNLSGSHRGSGGLTPTPTTVPPLQSSSVRSHPSAIPSAVTPSPVGAPTLASPVTDMSWPGCNRGAPADTPPVDLLSDLPSSINVILPNGATLPQQIVYESLPCFCKQCKILGHLTLTCTKGLKPRSKKRPHESPVCSASSSPSAETAAVEKQEPYCAGPSVDPQMDLISTEAATVGALRPQSPGLKRSKAATSKRSSSTPPIHHSEAGAIAAVAPPTRQYLTRSKVTAIPCLGSQRKSKAPAVDFQSLHSSDDSLYHPLSDDLFHV